MPSEMLIACRTMMVVMCLGLLAHHQVSACSYGCLNGGTLMLPNNIFGNCRCRCPPGFRGPKCQFGLKRSSFDLENTIDGLAAVKRDGVERFEPYQEEEELRRAEKELNDYLAERVNNKRGYNFH